MRIAIVGYGAMGKLIHSMAKDEVVAIVGKEYENGLASLFDYKDTIDVIIDFSNPANLDMILDYATIYKTKVVIGTTGLTPSDEKKIEIASSKTAILRSGNFSLGVILMNRLIREITPILANDYDIEVIEKHHNKKIDSPSGTAQMFVNTMIEKTGFTEKNGRVGYSPRDSHEIGVHSVRGGTIVGEHEVLFCGTDEVLSIKHSADSKRIFAVGALKAALFMRDKDTGFFNMENVLFPNEN